MSILPVISNKMLFKGGGESRRVKRFHASQKDVPLGTEMAKESHFIYTGCIGDSPGGGCLIANPGEEMKRRLNDPLAGVFRSCYR
jgi:hypothetical protein